MNLIEFKLLSIKKRNHNFVFDHITSQDATINNSDLEVVVKDSDNLVYVCCSDKDTLVEAYTSCITVLTYKPFCAIVDLAIEPTVSPAAMSAPKVKELGQGDLEQIVSAWLTGQIIAVTKVNFGTRQENSISTNMRSTLTTIHYIAINTAFNDVILDATGGLSVAKQTELIDLADIPLGILDTLYDSVMVDKTTLHNLNYYIL